jgi:hypothetical protein
MAQREKLMFVYDADGSVGVVMEFSRLAFASWAMTAPVTGARNKSHFKTDMTACDNNSVGLWSLSHR